MEQAAFWTEYLALLLADGFAPIGRRDAAVQWRTAAVDRGSINYPYLAKHAPFLESLRGDAELESHMNRVRRRGKCLR